MDNKKKILLGEKDIMSKDNEDLFININLNSTFNEIKDSKYENIFDVEKQWKKERNSSRDFRIYGTVDSTINDCENLIIEIYDSIFYGIGINSGITQLSGFIKSIKSTKLVYDGLNSYAKKKGKYLIELSGYTKDFVYIKIPTNNITYKDQIYSQQLIFRDSDGLFIDYGTKTIEISEKGNVFDVNNDFYFLYNKHWIKKDLLISGESKSVVSFSASPISENVLEASSSINPNYSLFSVVLDKSSPFGFEKVDMDIFTTTLNPLSEISILDNNFLPKIPPFTIDFSIGEQIKDFYFLSPSDNEQEFIEDVVFELTNFKNVGTGSTLTHTFFVSDVTPRNRAIFNFQNIYQNRNYFTGIVNTFSSISSSYSMPAVMRNGLFFEGTPMEFYPSDNFVLKIKNVGTNTILPINNVLGVANEQIFLAGHQLSFNVNLQYKNTEKHSIKLYFSNFNNTSNAFFPLLYSYNGGMMINGIPVIDYYRKYKVDYEKFLSSLKNIPVSNYPFWTESGNNISGWNRYNLDIPFSIEENLSALTITITAKNPGTRLDISMYGSLNFVNIFDVNNNFGLTAETMQAFVYSAQTQLEILLGANFGNNLQAKYEFELSKKGFNTMNFSSSPVNASITPSSYFLASGYHDVLRNWNDSKSEVVYFHSGITSSVVSTNYMQNGLYNSGEVYINGIVFLANQYFDNTQNTGNFIYGGASINISNFKNYLEDYSADFLLSPIAVIPETTSYFSVNNVSQTGYFRILNPYTPLPSIVITDRSFDFRTGTTGPYNTYTFSDINQSYIINHVYKSSGGILNTNSITYLPIETYFENGQISPLITNQGLHTYPIAYAPSAAADYAEVLILEASGNYIGVHTDISSPINYMKINSKSPGVPFSFINFKEMQIGVLDYTKNSVNYFELIPNQIAGLTVNLANNKMGGYTLLRPIAPFLAQILSISFEQPVYYNNLINSKTTIKISLNNPSINGNESIVIIKGVGSAFPGINYLENENYPYILVWAIGEQDKYISFDNKLSLGFTKNLSLQITSLINVISGPYLSSVIFFS